MSEVQTVPKQREEVRASEPRAEVRTDWEYVEGWGMAVGAEGRVYRPRSVEEIRAAHAEARAAGVPLGLRGTGCSYGDASVNERGYTLDITRMNRILDWDPETGIADLEAGVTLGQLWKHILADGWWPRVVSGTMFPTVAGAAAMNIHGKNNFRVGTFGDCILDFDLVLASGEVRTCSRDQNADLFHAAIGGFGMLGTFSRIRLQTKKVHSGDLEVRGVSNRNLREMMDWFESREKDADYLVGWIDCFAKGQELGRGLIHDARYLDPGEDPEPEATLELSHQLLPGHILGFPKDQVWRILRVLQNDLGMRILNAVKYVMGRVEGMHPPIRQSHAGFAFLLDYVPNWKWAYGRKKNTGLIQYQMFLPKETAHDTLCEVLRRCQDAGHVSYLGVFKRHRPDPFWMTHSVDGWSLALDFPVNPKNRGSLWRQCRDLTELVLAAGGKFYFAKDLVIGPDDARRFFPEENLERFLALKRELDPDGLFETNLWRRVFG
jgi:FAD/FMN-containing dehydrogenase